MFSKGTLIIAILLFSWGTVQIDVEAAFNEGYAQFLRAEFPSAIDTLRKAESGLTSTTPNDLAAKVLLYLGQSLIGVGQADDAADAAEGVFYKLCQRDPNYELERRVVSSKVFTSFNRARDKCRAELAAACAQRCETLNSAIAMRDVSQIQLALENLSGCDCDNGRSKAIRTILDIANKEYDERQFKDAQAHFQIAVQLDSALQSAIRGFGTVVLTSADVGGSVSIDRKFALELQAGKPSELLFSSGSHQLEFIPKAPNYENYGTNFMLPRDMTSTLSLSPQLKTISLNPGQPFDLDTGKLSEEGADIRWIQVEQTRSLLPQTKAQLVPLPTTDVFETLAAEAVRNAPVRARAILGGQLEGRVIVVKTSDDAYAKVRVDSVDRILKFRWVLYK